MAAAIGGIGLLGSLIAGLGTMWGLKEIAGLFKESEGSRKTREKYAARRFEAFLTRKLETEQMAMRRGLVDPGQLMGALDVGVIPGLGAAIANEPFGSEPQSAPTPQQLSSAALDNVSRNASRTELASLGRRIGGIRPETMAIFQSALSPPGGLMPKEQPLEFRGNPFTGESLMAAA